MPGEVRVPTWDNVTAESAAFFRSNIPGLRPVSGTLETDDPAISLIEPVSALSVGVGRIVQGAPEGGRREGIYGVAAHRQAHDQVARIGAEAVHLVEGPRELGGHPRLVLLCEDPDGTISRQCALVAPREDVQQGVV